MNNRLQFRHHGVGSGYTIEDMVFATREDAVGYAKNSVDSLYGEPLVLRYKNEENEDDPYLMVLVGSVTNDTNILRNNRFCIIDVHKTESEISELRDEVEKIVASLTLIVENSDTLELNTQETDEGVYLSGNVKVPQSHKFDSDTVFKENKLVVDEDGIFIYVDFDYDERDGTIKFTLNDSEKEFNIGTNTVTGGVYNERDECIHLNMKFGDDIVIDVDKLIGEWTVEGDATNSPIVLKREEVEYGGGSTHYHVEPWQDILSADVRIAEDRVNNILSKTSDNRYLYVDGVASNICYYKDGSKTNVKEVLDDLVKIKISDDSQNILMKKADGFFASSKLEYISNQNTLVFTTSNQEPKTIRLNSFRMFENIIYDPSTESLIITYIDNEGQTKFVEIPVGEMLREWDVNNYGHSVHLQKVSSVQGPDQLSADVRICNLEDNIIKEVAHELYVKGTADNIKYSNSLSVKDKIDELGNEITAEVERLTNEDVRLQREIDALSSDTLNNVESVNSADGSIEVDNSDAKNPTVKVNISEAIEDDKENIIKLNSDGLYAGVDLDYYFESGTSKNVLVFKTTNGTKTFDLKTNSVVDRIYYDPTREAIIIEYTINGVRMPDVVIPVRDMIDEIDVQSTTTIELTKTKDTSAGRDFIRGYAIISTTHDDNILADDGGLYVSGSQIEENKNKIAENATAIENEVSRATAKENEISTSLNNEVVRATSAETAINNTVSQLDAKIDNETNARVASDESITNSISTLETKVDTEIARSTEKDNALQASITQEVNDRITAITSEQNRATSAETALQTAINEESAARVNADDSLRRDISDEVSRAQSAEDTIASNLEAETIRATAVETANATAIDGEIARATAAEAANATAIENEVSRATSEEQRIENKVNELADATTLVARNTNSVTLTKTQEERGSSLSADVKISSGNGNVIKVETDGLYADVDLLYDATSNKLTFKTTNGNKEIALVSNSLVERVYYDAANEKIVIVYKVNGQTMPDVEVPVRDLINEITVESTSSIEMNKTISVEGSDVITANVKLNTVHDDNILLDDGGLYVSGAQIDANKEAIKELQAIVSSSDTRVEEVEAKLDLEIARATAAEAANTTAIENEVSRATAKENEISSNLSNETTRATNAETEIRTALNAEIARSTEKDEALQTAITQEVNDRTNAITAETTRATSAETEIRTALNNEIARSTTADETNAANISANTNAINAEKTRAEGVESSLNSAVTANATAIATEKARAELAESNISNAVNSETARATSEEARIEAKIDNEVTRAREAEAALNDKIDAKTFEVIAEDTATIDMVVSDGNKISGNVLIANGDCNIIKASSDSETGTGIYASVDLSYDAATNKLKLTTSALEKEIALSIGSILKSIEYDSVAKNLIIKYDTNSAGQIIEQTLTVPVEDLFNDWVVQQGEHLGAIILHKDEGESGNPDVLSAEIVLSTLSDNMLINDQGALYVSRRPIDELSAATEENTELINNIISGSGLGHDGKFSPASVIGRKYISNAESIMDAAIMLDSAIEGVNDDLAAISGNDNTYSVRLTRDEASKHLSADVKLAQTPNAADIDVTLSHEQYAELKMKNLLKVIHVVESEKDASTNGLFFDGSIDYGSYDNLGNITYEN